MESKIDMCDFGGSWAQTYTEECECGKEVEVSTQKDDCPEYHTDIFVKCECGKSVKLIIPVN